MSRRTAASLLAILLLVVLGLQVARLSVPFVTVSPGVTVDVLGENGGEPVVDVEGHRTYPTDGEMRLTTVSVTNPEAKVTLVGALAGWFDDDVAVLPYEAMYPDRSSAEQERAESAAQMVNSQDTAVAVALTELGYDLPTYAEVTGITPGGPSAKLLKPRDRILAVDGRPVEDVEDVFRLVGRLEVGEPATVEVRRGGEDRRVEITPTAAPDDPDRALLGILVGTGYEFPFDVRVGIDDTIGGPSAGLMFALSVYDVLTPGALLDGTVVAGTGSIDADGRVGPIGGIRQKIAGAEESGATLFLVPPDNCAVAVGAPVDSIELVRADTFSSALDSLQKYVEDPDAELPRCDE
ncbi:PDZ domain-containing protein [Nocardioides caldifontis]|uniref:YlbL family protein n=1 Tax=Nocardioides caldifontis TaxID=2588938 RepID=UPI0011DF692A|nr:PDZ domain-containing protein [Nocardioides caldifontis]